MSERKSKWDAPSSSSADQQASDPAAAAAAAAARIEAQFKQAQQQQQLGSSSHGESSSNADGQAAARRRDRETRDGEFVEDIEINDLRNRYMLTKTQTQKQIHEDTGAVITTKGLWYPDKEMATDAEPPLYLHVSAPSKDSLTKAVEQINEIIKSDLPQLIEDRQAKRQEYEQRRNTAAPAPTQRREWSEERVPIGLESLRNFNVRAKIVGPQGIFVKYIQNETGTRVQIKGQGSGFIETNTGYEAPDPMFIAIAGPDAGKVTEAKELAEDLMDAVKTEHGKAMQMMMQQQQQWQGAGAGSQPYQNQHHMQSQPYQHAHDGGYQGDQGYGSQAAYGENRQRWNAAPGAHQPPQPHGIAPPLPSDDAPPPPPPEDAAPPPPPPNEAARPAPKKKTPEEEALEKYWKDYITWEKSFKDYHGRLPKPDEGLQDVPPEFRD